MKKTLLLCLIAALSSAANAEILLPDPTIFAENGIYYLTGTGTNKDGVFSVYKSKDLETWAKAGNAIKKGDTVGDKCFWAPQIFKHDGKYKIAYCAFSEKDKKHFLAIAETDDLDKGFKNSRALKSDVNFEIDPFIFFDDDNRAYIYFVHWGQDGLGGLCGQELSADLNSRIGELKILVNNDQPWEIKPLPEECKILNKAIADKEAQYQIAPKTIEGPTLLKRNGKYVMFYSANDFRTPDYCIGVAVSDSPLGKFKKLQNGPIISREITGLYGSGHGDIFFDSKGDMWYVFHAHHSNISISPRRTAVIKLIETFDSDGNPHYKADYKSMRLL